MIWLHLQTIFSFRAYHLFPLTSHRQRIGFLAYLVLLALTGFYFFSQAYVRQNLPIFLKNFPEITFDKGILTAPQTAVSVPVPSSMFQITFNASQTTAPAVNDLLEKNTLILFTKNTLYMPGFTGLQNRPIPAQWDVTTTPQWLEKNQSIFAAFIRGILFAFALFFIPLTLLFDFCIAGMVGLFFNLLQPRRVSRGRVLTWAFFMLGPLTALWLVRLWINIPLFTFARFILCIIYMQQIFNTLPEEN